MQRQVFWAALSILLLLPFAGSSQEQSQPAQVPVPGATQLAPGLGKDTQFLALLRIRDIQFSQVQEIRRILSFHDDFRIRMDKLLRENPPITRTMSDKDAVEEALRNIEKLEKQVEANATDKKGMINIVKIFDEEFPLFEPDLPVTRISGGSPMRQLQRLTGSVRPKERLYSSLADEQTNIIEFFRNLSSMNKEWQKRYERITSMIENKASELASEFGPRRYPSLNALPPQFFRLADADSFDALTIEGVKTGAGRYKEALKAVLTLINTGNTTQDSAVLRLAVLQEVDKIGGDLQRKSKDQDEELKNIENNVTASARQLYGDKVGSSSFIYLLIVFAIVFGVIMIGPKLYSAEIAANILKAEFLLQFSTVFVLIAAIIILGIGELIAKDQVPVLLAGISGYVLGQLGKT